ncbi:MAG: prolyl oligopeptidase family serine peptidase [Pirellulaceae bacterium]|nr:prolyl oligopeptidase family serine peptidase [Pirellulaceae bacterium]
MPSPIRNDDAVPTFEIDIFADRRDRFEAFVLDAWDGGRLPYRLLKPWEFAALPPGAAPNAQQYPLLVFLHGAGERGQDNRCQLVHGMNEFASDEIMARYPCFVAAPQCPADQQWVDTPWSADSHRMADEPTPVLRWTLELIDHLAERYPVDPRRIYLSGLSMGGFGVWELLARRPRQFAAAVIICGGGDPATAPVIAHVPVWAFHGDSDPAVKPQRSRDMVRAIEQAGGSPKHTEYLDTGHDSWSVTYRDPRMYAWLFAQRTDGPVA